MVFGRTASTSSWESIHRAPEGFEGCVWGMLRWNIPTRNKIKPVRAIKCALNPGLLDSTGNQKNHPARIWVYGALIEAIGVTEMKMTLAAVIEAIVTVMGEPDPKRR